MKIAIASEGKLVSPHFGHCEGFQIYHVESGSIVDRSFLPNPGHQPGLLPQLLAEAGVSTVIAGGMGAGAIDLLETARMEVITGATGDTEATLRDFLSGRLISSGAVCHEHAHHCDCHEHNH